MKPQREHVVAASLVGTVVVVLGFASGIGQVPQSQGQQGQVTTTQPSSPPPSSTHPHTPPPAAHHVPQPVRHNPMHPVHPASHVPAPHAPSHPHPPSTTPSTTMLPEPGKPCDIGAITKLLHEVGALVGELPVLTEATEGLSILDTGLLSPLLGAKPVLPTDLLKDLLGEKCELVVEPRTGQVTALLSTP